MLILIHLFELFNLKIILMEISIKIYYFALLNEKVTTNKITTTGHQCNCPVMPLSKPPGFVGL